MLQARSSAGGFGAGRGRGTRAHPPASSAAASNPTTPADHDRLGPPCRMCVPLVLPTTTSGAYAPRGVPGDPERGSGTWVGESRSGSAGPGPEGQEPEGGGGGGTAPGGGGVAPGAGGGGTAPGGGGGAAGAPPGAGGGGTEPGGGGGAAAAVPGGGGGSEVIERSSTVVASTSRSDAMHRSRCAPASAGALPVASR